MLESWDLPESCLAFSLLLKAHGVTLRFPVLFDLHRRSSSFTKKIAIVCGALLGDKAFDADWLRAVLDNRGAAAVIPPKANRRTAIHFDRDMYGWRHLTENTFAKLKGFRA
jgi:hypothetical protein